ncbi:MAG: hypothetical protein B1H40_05110 [Candidatus Latescibacteria bacterium 4484_181]|nr:MAG: hypothetical protein B1H40_05110 [Candidatus Latescibacteria bacterium 4484_181]RKY66230.1 MAG: hypothetical protein DRQ02_09165 [Candidatus Latescibacterota bacterium]RKY72559.1 MAG: hypothetical protein DRQ24_04735 [Candidatus Latescibacterota bacterium]
MASLICRRHFVLIGTDKRWAYQKAFLAAKFVRKSQRAQRANYLSMKPSPALYPIPFFAVILSDKLLVHTRYGL